MTTSSITRRWGVHTLEYPSVRSHTMEVVFDSQHAPSNTTSGRWMVGLVNGIRVGSGSGVNPRAGQQPNTGCLRKTLHQRGVTARGLGSTINPT